MVNIRLMGMPEEVEIAKEKLKKDFDVVMVSEPYPMRGSKDMVRVYVYVEVAKKQC